MGTYYCQSDFMQENICYVTSIQFDVINKKLVIYKTGIDNQLNISFNVK